MERSSWSRIYFFVSAVCLLLTQSSVRATGEPARSATATFRQYCLGCHGKAAMGGLSLEKLLAEESVGDSFLHWERVALALEDRQMPPSKMPQPSDSDRAHAAAWIRSRLREYAEKHAGDPGRVTVRRLTGAEYTYTIRDLTGLDLEVGGDLSADSAGGEGFTNFGDVQFMDDAGLERYLEAAKTVAAHAVIGSGPVEFFEDPGKTGLELSAISRIQEIYRGNGFRGVSGEGGKPYGVELYAKAFYAAWRYRHRGVLGDAAKSLAEIGAEEGVSARFAEHIWAMLHDASAGYPTTEVSARWRSLPTPAGPDARRIAADARARSDVLQEFVTVWARWLFGAGGVAEGGLGDERSFELTAETLQPKPEQTVKFAVRGGRRKVEKPGRIHLSVTSVNPGSQDKPIVIWRNATIRFRGADVSDTAHPLREVAAAESLERLGFGKAPAGPDEFAMAADSALYVDIAMPPGAGALEIEATVTLTAPDAGDAVVRCTLADQEYQVLTGGTPFSVLLGHPDTAAFQAWKAGVLFFAENMPQNSQGEPTPSDKDPIPAPFNNVYNQPERDRYHLKVKYYRQDPFIVGKILNDAQRKRLNEAWTDLLTSFEYHDAFFDFVEEKFKLDLKGKSIVEMTPEEIAALPEVPRRYGQTLRTEYDAMMAARKAAEPGHIEDCIRFADRAWRRPLSETEKQGLRNFYASTRRTSGLDHPRAIRALLTRILVAPAFLYRVEPAAAVASGVRPLNNWEMASRLSYFLWSSVPDGELRRAAAAGELTDPARIERQVKRMLADPKARRFATEFFGQWLGFYRFDTYRGVDTGRFPEFTEDVKKAMYDEAVLFFDHIVRQDRPVGELLTANYTFLNQALAKFYGVDKELDAADAVRVDDAHAFQRGGMLRLGAVLTATSAPLRTSPVKRGDWVLRRVLGTPTPPPPADAGSIPADDKQFAGLSIFERLAAHQRNATCAGCHSRIDPLGFPLERYDAVGRWRDTYADGKPVHDTASLADKTELAGVGGLLDYLSAQERQVLRNLSFKLIGYALGRTVLGSDQPLVESLVADGGRTNFSKLIAGIATSRQFRYRRGDEGAAPQTAGGPAPRNPDTKGGS
ncbi:MAG: DUF1592 domain-containing protein [Bryobacterales bacterium]|nr:DUF1592 domain-containing protein [Bryobacterales bacterium]